MSQNMDLVRSICAEWERGDFGSAEWADPQIEVVMVGGPEPGTWRGIAGAAEFTRGFLSAWNEIRLVADDYREVDHERIVVLVHYSGHGSTSGVDLGQMGTEHANLFHLRNGKVTRYVVYWDLESAPAELGITPDGG
jgi:ketosteroid isomerase-like protein